MAENIPLTATTVEDMEAWLTKHLFVEERVPPTRVAPYAPKRGRGRATQLASMTEHEIHIESEQRLERNRLASRELRRRKKADAAKAAARLAELEDDAIIAKRLIAHLSEECRRLHSELIALKSQR